jgi:catechol 2,3-dioxygenase-like lactoylglutathione lyase family enzyme
MPPFALVGLDHVVLLVAGMDRAVGFYESVLGCSVERRLPKYGMTQLRAGASLIDLVDIASSEGAWARPEIGGGRNVDHVCLATGPWDEAAMRAHLAASGVAIEEEGIRYGAGGDSLSFYVRDPDGNLIELTRPPERQES